MLTLVVERRSRLGLDSRFLNILSVAPRDLFYAAPNFALTA